MLAAVDNVVAAEADDDVLATAGLDVIVAVIAPDFAGLSSIR